MNELRRKTLVRRIDESWLAIAADLLGIEAETKNKDELVKLILASRDENPATLLFLLHQGVVSLMLNVFGDSIGAEGVTDEEKATIKKKLLVELKTIHDEDFPVEHPNHSLASSAAFAELLVEEGHLPELMLEWSDDVNDVMSTVLISHELWNLISYYGIIAPDDLLRMHAAAHGEPEALPHEILGMAQGYIELNLSDEIFLEEIEGQDYFLSEYKGIDADEILEDRKGFQEDYKVVDMDDLMEMIHGVSPDEMMELVDYIIRAFKLSEEDEALLADADFMQSLVVTLQGRGAMTVPKYLHEDLKWEWGVADEEARELIFQELLDAMPRYHLKGHSVADLSGYPEGDMDEEEDGYIDEDELFDELSFRRRKKSGDDENFLN